LSGDLSISGKSVHQNSDVVSDASNIPHSENPLLLNSAVETVEKVRNGDEMSGNFAQGSVNYSYSREVRGTDGEI
jgi:hypothetical protein